MKNLMAALAAAKADFPPLRKTAENPHFHSRYTPLNEVIDTIRPVLHQHGLEYITGFGRMFKDEADKVDPADSLTIYLHLFHVESGETFTTSLNLPVTKPNPQQVGSAISYGRRYLLTTVFDLAAPDDDGESASEEPVTDAWRTPPQRRTMPQPVKYDRMEDDEDEPPPPGELAAPPQTPRVETPQVPGPADGEVNPYEPAIFYDTPPTIQRGPKSKATGKQLVIMDDSELVWWITNCKQVVEDPSKARYKQKNEAELNMFLKEQKRRQLYEEWEQAQNVGDDEITSRLRAAAARYMGQSHG